MISLHFIINLNRTFDILEDDEYSDVYTYAYQPLLAAIEDLRLHTTIFPTGFSLESMKQESPETLQQLGDLQRHGIAQLGNHTYGHAIIPLISTEDICKHIDLSQTLERDIFGSASTAFYPPEFAIDPTLPYLMNNHGLSWVLLHNSNYLDCYGHSQEDVFKIGVVSGIMESQVRALTIYGDADEWIRGQLHAVLAGDLGARPFVSTLIERVKRETNKCHFDPVLCLYTDAETPYFNRDADNPDPVAHLRRVFELLLQSPEIRSRSALDLVGTCDIPTVNLTLKMRSTYKPFDLWTIGSEKLDRLIAEARSVVYTAAMCRPAKDAQLTQMWRHYLLSQASDCRSALSERRTCVSRIGRQWRCGNVKRTIQGYEHALSARAIARSILGA